jgi:UDP-2,3-diacylglucosamine pyrophosphatase LpxH
MAIITFVDKGFVPMATLQAPVLVTEADIQNAPMIAEHKELVLMHHRRLFARLPGEYSQDQQAALESLVRVTLIFRDYATYQIELLELLTIDEEDSMPTTIESMIVDILDACIPLCGVAHPIKLPPLYSTPRDDEVRTMVRQYNTFHRIVEDVARRARALSKVVPDRHDRSTREDIGEGIDWPKALKRARSADDVFRMRHTFEVRDRLKLEKIWREERNRKWDEKESDEEWKKKASEEELEKHEREKRDREEEQEEEELREKNLRSGKVADQSLQWPPGKGERREGMREG